MPQPATAVEDSLAFEDRFLDLLDPVEDTEDDIADLPQINAGGKGSMTRQESSHGPLHWNTRCSTELQDIVDSFYNEDLYSFGFSVTVADPSQPDCPLIACSAGFTELTGYTVQEIVGRNCRFLLNGVPSRLVDEETRVKCRAFCISSKSGEDYAGVSEVLPPELSKPWIELPKGEMICVQTNARKSGELFRNMFYLKQVELDERPFIIGLQAGLADEYEDGEEHFDLQKKCAAAFGRLEENMSQIEQVLAQQFWYSAPMRRQI